MVSAFCGRRRFSGNGLFLTEKTGFDFRDLCAQLADSLPLLEAFRSSSVTFQLATQSVRQKPAGSNRRCFLLQIVKEPVPRVPASWVIISHWAGCRTAFSWFGLRPQVRRTENFAAEALAQAARCSRIRGAQLLARCAITVGYTLTQLRPGSKLPSLQPCPVRERGSCTSTPDNEGRHWSS